MILNNLGGGKELDTPTITVSSAGLITATANDKTATKQLTTQAAQTITPGTTAKTIASGRYLTGTQTIAGDANLLASNIKSGVSIFGVSGGLLTADVKSFTGDGSAYHKLSEYSSLSQVPRYCLCWSANFDWEDKQLFVMIGDKILDKCYRAYDNGSNTVSSRSAFCVEYSSSYGVRLYANMARFISNISFKYIFFN